MIRLFRNKRRKTEELLSAYIDGRLSAKEEAKVESLVASSEEWRAELESLRATVAAVRRAPRARPTRSFALTPAMVEMAAPQREWTARRTAAPLATAAAALLLTFSLVGGATDLFSSSAEPAPAEIPGAAEAPATEGQDAPAPDTQAPGPQAAPAAPRSAVGEAASEEGAEAAPADSARSVAPAVEEALTPELLDTGSRFPWLALELTFGILTGLLVAVTVWLYRRPRAHA